MAEESLIAFPVSISAECSNAIDIVDIDGEVILQHINEEDDCTAFEFRRMHFIVKAINEKCQALAKEDNDSKSI